jgi:CAAX prenyl protease-like protein
VTGPRAETVAFLAACALAGGLAVPWNPPLTLAAALVTTLLAALGLGLARWAELPGHAHVPGSPVGTLRFLLLGFLVGVVVLAVLRFAIQPLVPAIGERIAAAGRLPVWRRGVVIYVAAVVEEIVFRLLLLSLLAGILTRALRRFGERGRSAAVWSANLLAAGAFGAAHLPSWAGIPGAGPALALCVLALNLTGGIVFGKVFTTRGIVPAMLTHGGADAAVQWIGPLTG